MPFSPIAQNAIELVHMLDALTASAARHGPVAWRWQDAYWRGYPIT